MTTNILMILFGHNQPYEQALSMPCDIVLELLESKLEERLHYLDGDKSRLALKELTVTREFGSVKNFSSLLLEKDAQAPTL